MGNLQGTLYVPDWLNKMYVIIHRIRFTQSETDSTVPRNCFFTKKKLIRIVHVRRPRFYRMKAAYKLIL